MNISLSPCVPENLVSRDGFSRPVPRQPAHLHTQAESGAYLRDSSRVPRRRPFMKPTYATGSVPSLSGHAIAYRWRSLPRVRRHRASKSQGSSERVLPWQVRRSQLGLYPFCFFCFVLFHDYFFYESQALHRQLCSGILCYFLVTLLVLHIRFFGVFASNYAFLGGCQNLKNAFNRQLGYFMVVSGVHSSVVFNACVYVCMYVCMVITYSRVWINRIRLPILLVVS